MYQLAPNQRHGGFAVRTPHPADGVGLALAQAFRDETALPKDMQRALDVIDRCPRN